MRFRGRLMEYRGKKVEMIGNYKLLTLTPPPKTNRKNTPKSPKNSLPWQTRAESQQGRGKGRNTGGNTP